MRKGGRPSKNPGRLKDGYYMLISLDNLRKPIRIMSETLEQMKVAQDRYKNYHCKYLGQVKNHLWIDGENKGKPTT